MTDLRILDMLVMEMDLSRKAIDILHKSYTVQDVPVCSFAQAIGAELLGCDWTEVTPEQIRTIEHALERRIWGGPTE